MINKTITWFVKGAVCAYAIFFLWACAIGPSHFRRSYNVSNSFENAQLINDHQYYYSGLPYRPDAVVGIRRGFHLKSPHWEPVDLDDRRLRHMVDEMLNNPGAEYNTEPNGAYIFDDNGETIGVWYSVWALPILKFTSENEFTISRPTINFPRSNKDPEERGRWPFSKGF